MSFRTLDSADLKGKRVLVRVDLNLPMDGGKVTDATRIERILPTLNEISQKGAKVIMLAHFGRPKNGPDEANSLKPVAAAVAQHLGKPVAFASDCIGPVAAQAVNAMKDGDFLLLENTRFHKGEEKNDPSLIDAHGRPRRPLCQRRLFGRAPRPCVDRRPGQEAAGLCGPHHAGGSRGPVQGAGKPAAPGRGCGRRAKVSSKLELLGNLTKKVDFLIIGGGMANTFLAAQGKKVGKSLCEHDLLDTAREILNNAAANKCQIVLPVDAVVAQEFRAHAPLACRQRRSRWRRRHDPRRRPEIGDRSRSRLTAAKTLVWNGPFGAFELEPFDAATNAVAKFAARLTTEGKLLSVACGGDTVAALNHAGAADNCTDVSTAGGALPRTAGRQGPARRRSDPRVICQGVHQMARITLRQLLDHAAEHDVASPPSTSTTWNRPSPSWRRRPKLDAPVIIQALRGARQDANDVMLKHMMDACAEIYPQIPICVHQDHGNGPATCFTAMQARFYLGDDGRFAQGRRQDPGRWDYNVNITNICDRHGPSRRHFRRRRVRRARLARDRRGREGRRPRV